MKIRGRVKKGLKIGRALGYPTANLEISGGKASGTPEALPRTIEPGVYVARAVVNNTTHYAVAVIGARMARVNPLIEVHLFDFSGDLYGKTIEVDILEKISEIETFEDDARLVRKIEEDIKKERVCLQELSMRQGA